MAARKPVYDLYPPKIESDESLELALAEFCRVDAVEKQVKARTSDATARIRQEYAESLVVSVGKEKELPLADWKESLEKAIEKYAKRNKARWIEDGKKSRDFNHGTIGWRKGKPSVQPIGDFTSAGDPGPLDQVIELIRKAMTACAKMVGALRARFIDVKVGYRKAELLKAIKDKELDPEELAKIGFEYQNGEDTFFIDPKIDDVSSPSGGS